MSYLMAPGGIPKALGARVALGAMASPLLWRSSVHDVASALGAAAMLWWLGFKVREKAENSDPE